MRSSGNCGGSRRNTCFRLLVDSCTKKPLDAFGWKCSGKNTLISKAYIYQNKMAQNPGFRHSSFQMWRCNSHGFANAKYTFDCKLRSGQPPGRMFIVKDCVDHCIFLFVWQVCPGLLSKTIDNYRINSDQLTRFNKVFHRIAMIINDHKPDPICMTMLGLKQVTAIKQVFD